MLGRGCGKARGRSAPLEEESEEDDDVVANLLDGVATSGLPVPIYGQYLAPRTYGMKLTRSF